MPEGREGSKPAVSHRDEGQFAGVWARLRCAMAGVTGQNQWTIMERRVESGGVAALEGDEWREAKLGCPSKRRKVCGENGGRKAILCSFKELLFHAKLKSHSRDYMPANNVRQISI